MAGVRRRPRVASLAVPLDWDDPDGHTIDLAVTRLPASGDDPVGASPPTRAGRASGNEFIVGGVFDDELTEQFDTISWDPRGVGGSAPPAAPARRSTTSCASTATPTTPPSRRRSTPGGQAIADRRGRRRR